MKRLKPVEIPTASGLIATFKMNKHDTLVQTYADKIVVSKPLGVAVFQREYLGYTAQAALAEFKAECRRLAL